jgi:hypothetical protein
MELERKKEVLRWILEDSFPKGSRAERERHRLSSQAASETRENGRCGQPWKRNIRKKG